jgi:hypothetical protein
MLTAPPRSQALGCLNRAPQEIRKSLAGQELLSHSTLAITLDTYPHVLPGMGDAAAEAMDEALG